MSDENCHYTEMAFGELLAVNRISTACRSVRGFPPESVSGGAGHNKDSVRISLVRFRPSERREFRPESRKNSERIPFASCRSVRIRSDNQAMKRTEKAPPLISALDTY